MVGSVGLVGVVGGGGGDCRFEVQDLASRPPLIQKVHCMYMPSLGMFITAGPNSYPKYDKHDLRSPNFRKL